MWTGRRGRSEPKPVRDRKCATAGDGGGSLKCEREAEFLQQRQHPGFAGDGRRAFLPRAIRALKAFQWISASEKAVWISSLRRPSRPKSVGTLARHLLRRRGDLLDEIAADQSALDRDSEVRHQPCPLDRHQHKAAENVGRRVRVEF